ncbi:MAG: hypothetical protein VX589_16800 [Myxococcota bacterium]|nr:hypothetical protein [Myxococcota bacterium]
MWKKLIVCGALLGFVGLTAEAKPTATKGTKKSQTTAKKKVQLKKSKPNSKRAKGVIGAKGPKAKRLLRFKKGLTKAQMVNTVRKIDKAMMQAKGKKNSVDVQTAIRLWENLGAEEKIDLLKDPAQVAGFALLTVIVDQVKLAVCNVEGIDLQRKGLNRSLDKVMNMKAVSKDKNAIRSALDF